MYILQYELIHRQPSSLTSLLPFSAKLFSHSFTEIGGIEILIQLLAHTFEVRLIVFSTSVTSGYEAVM